MNNQPGEWDLVNLKDLVEINPAEFDLTEPSAYTTVLPERGVPPFTKVLPLTRQENSRPADATGQSALPFRTGDILLDGTLRAGAIPTVTIAGAMLHQTGHAPIDYYVLRPKVGVNPAWLAHYLRFAVMHHHVMQQVVTNDPLLMRLPPALLNALRVPMPSRPTVQDDKAALMDEVLQLLSLRFQADRERGRLLTAIFRSICGDPAELWDTSFVNLDRVAAIQRGHTENLMPADLGGTVPYVQENDVVNNPIKATGQSLSLAAVAEGRAELYGPGRLVMALSGRGAARIGQIDVPSAVGQYVAVIWTNSPAYPNEFIWAWLLVTHELIRASRVKRGQIDASDLKEIPFPNVTPYQANQVAQAVNELRAAAETARQQKALIDRVYRWLLDQSFVLALQAPTVSGSPLEDAARARSVWRDLSKTQRRVWQLALAIDRPFGVDDLVPAFPKRFGEPCTRAELYTALQVLEILGAVIKHGRPHVDRWRRRNPELDQEAAR